MMILGRRRCPLCGQKFASEEELMAHKLAAHSKGGYDCRACGLEFASMEEMRAHLQRSHSYGR